MTVSFITLGCKVNQYESEAISELLEKEGVQFEKLLANENKDAATAIIMAYEK